MHVGEIMSWKALSGFGVLLLLFGCGDDGTTFPIVEAGTEAGIDAAADGPVAEAGSDATPDRMVNTDCGDGIVQAPEECDDANDSDDDECRNDCRFSCGDGEFNMMIEACDTAIAAGMPGACPTECDDDNACTSDVLSGSACDTACTNAPIEACVDDDGCCPTACNANTDNDCMPMCGNMVIEGDETCEAGVMDCPTACDDMNSCTMDVLMGDPAMCTSVCDFPAITMCSMTSDGCCPSACNSTTDVDCSASCNNGVFEPPGETCENGTAMPCPATCDDMDACTMNVRTGTAGMCNVQCSFPAITACAMASDGCCPAGCNATNDGDCMPVCGNMVVEGTEECDDGNMIATDGCDMCRRPPTAFRFTDLDLMDPHAFANILGCRDITNGSFFGQDLLNPILETSITTDDDMDGLLDLSLLLVFRPLNQSTAAGMMMGSGDIIEADCTAPASTTSCTRPMGSMPIASFTFTNQASGTCLGTTVGGSSVVRPYSPPVAVPGGPCFVSSAQSITIDIAGINIPLIDAQIAGTYVGSPATGVSNGLLRGFLTQAAARTTTLPASLPLIGGATLESVLRGGMGNCQSGSDIDTHPTAGAGWWMFLNFDGSTVPYTE